MYTCPYSSETPPELPELPEEWETKLSDIGIGHVIQLNSQRRSTAKKKYTTGFAPPDGRPHERPKPRKRRPRA